MAFNPFDVFRRNQKILFAGLTVVVMFMFVLSFGQGDFFSQVPRWLAARGQARSGAVLAELNGTKVYAGELEQVRGERVLANQYMAVAARQGAEALAKYVQESLPRASAETKPALEGANRARSLLNFLASQGGGLDAQTRNLVGQQLVQGAAGLDAVLANKSAKAEDLEIATAAKAMLELTDRSLASRTAHYFLNQPNDSNREVMEFLLWRRKADQLGIRLDDSAVIRLANEEFFNKLSDDDWKAAEQAVRGKQGFSGANLRRALADEFRVRAAQTAVTGGQSLRPSGQEFDAPFDYFQFYRDQTNTARYGLITVPADNYLDRVTGQPSESELERIFSKGRNVEPDPSQPGFGLKEPRRVKLGFVEITGTEGYYKAKAALTVAAAEGSGSGDSPAGAAARALAGGAGLAGFSGPVAKQYDRYKQDHARQVQSDWNTPTPFGGGRPLDTHALETLNVAAFAAAFASGNLLTAPAVLAADAFASDRTAKLESVLPVLTAPVGPGVGGLLGAVAGLQAFTRPLPLEAVRGVLLERAREEVGRQAAADDMTTLGTEVAALAAKPAEAQAKVEAFAKERGLKVGGSTELRDRYTLAADPGLAVLADRFQSEAQLQALRAGTTFVDPLTFSNRFFFDLDPATGQFRPSTALFRPQTFPESAQRGPEPGRPAFLVWRTDDKPAESARTLTDPAKNRAGQTVRDKAVLAWKQGKARELARAAADEVAKRAGGTNPTEVEMRLRDEAAKLAGGFPSPEAKARVSYFEIDPVAPLVTSPGLLAGRGGVVPFNAVPRSTFVPYPTPAMRDVLLANRSKPVGTAEVLTDQPGDRAYVAVVVQKTERDADTFGLTVYSPTAQFNPLAQALASEHQRARSVENRARAVSLLKAEFRYEKESDELNKRAEGFGD